jgi:hypothetical protein
MFRMAGKLFPISIVAAGLALAACDETPVGLSPDERGRIQVLDVQADSVMADVNAGARFVVVRATDRSGQAVCPALDIQVADRSVADVTQDEGGRLRVSPNFAGRTRVTVSADSVSDMFTVVVTSERGSVIVAARPAATAATAGATVSYSVRVRNEQGTPVSGQVVNFDVTAGRLVSASATTDANGVATVQWVLPTNLREQGNFQRISFATQFANGVVRSGADDLSISAGPVASVTLVSSDTRVWTPVTGSTITARTFQTVYLGVRGEDQFGNFVLVNPATTYTITGPSVVRQCGNETDTFLGVRYTCFYGSTVGATATFTATVPALGTSSPAFTRSVNVSFTA